MIWIFRSNLGDCSHGGISSRTGRVILTTDANPTSTCNLPGVRIIRHPAGPNYPDIAVPVDDEGNPLTGGMMGGTFVYSSDSRFPNEGPVALHDRFER